MSEAEKPAVSDRDTIGFTQENVAAQMAELEERMFRLSEALRSLEPAVRLAEFLTVPLESLLVPALVLLAVIVGLWPAVSAYRTDVAKSLGK